MDTGEVRPVGKGIMAVLMALVVSGCAMAPGGHIDYETETPDISHLVDIEPITPELVRAYRSEINGDIASVMPAELQAEIENYHYLVEPGDILSIIVYDHPELTIPAGPERSAAEAGNRVHRDGTIFYPYIGRVRVAGRTIDDIRSILTQRLSDFLTDPQIEVSVAAYNSKKVYISGAVGAPGTIPITAEPLTILDAISQVGGPSDSANWHKVILNRDGEKQEISLYALLRQGDQNQNRLLRDGDVLHVPSLESESVAVLGQVRSPGNLGLGNERITLTTALAKAGGVVEARAEPSGIFIIRAQPENSDKIATVYQLDISDATALTMGTHFPLQPQDIVYVTSAPLARWNNVISLLLPSVALPGTLADTTTDLGDL